MIKKYVEENKDRMLEELFSLIRIPSVSAQTAHKEDMVRCAERWKELLLQSLRMGISGHVEQTMIRDNHSCRQRLLSI